MADLYFSNFDAQLHRRLKIKAAQDATTLKALVEAAVRAFLRPGSGLLAEPEMLIAPPAEPEKVVVEIPARFRSKPNGPAADECDQRQKRAPSGLKAVLADAASRAGKKRK